MKRTAEIVGCGLAGLVTGLALAQNGWRVRIHGQDNSLRLTGEGIFIWENGLRVLDALGMLEPVTADGIRIVRYERRNQPGKRISSSGFGEDFRLYGLLRDNLLTALQDAFLETGGTILFSSRAVAADAGGCLHFADGRLLGADLVVAADGVDSSVRDSLGLLKWRLSTNQRVYRAVIPHARNDASEGIYCEYWSGPHRLLYARCAAGSAWVQLSSPANRSGNTVSLDHEFWRSLFPELTSVVDCIPASSRSDVVLASLRR